MNLKFIVCLKTGLDVQESKEHIGAKAVKSGGFGRKRKAPKTKAGLDEGRTLQEGVCQRCLRRVRQHGCD